MALPEVCSPLAYYFGKSLSSTIVILCRQVKVIPLHQTDYDYSASVGAPCFELSDGIDRSRSQTPLFGPWLACFIQHILLTTGGD